MCLPPNQGVLQLVGSVYKCLHAPYSVSSAHHCIFILHLRKERLHQIKKGLWASPQVLQMLEKMELADTFSKFWCTGKVYQYQDDRLPLAARHSSTHHLAPGPCAKAPLEVWLLHVAARGGTKESRVILYMLY
jgi:hypothetical protein